MVDACDFLSIEQPVLQGAMGGVARHDLVVAVSKAGGLGTVSYLPPQMFADELKRVEQSLSGTTFAANLLMPVITDVHVKACLDSSVPIVTLFYGFDQKIVSALKDAGKIVLFQVGSVNEAKRVIAAGADGVIAQGYEAGGHIRGTTRLSELLPEIRSAFPDHLVCGAGGVHDKSSAGACRDLGADAVASGTRFLTTPEAAAHPAYKQRLVDAVETVATNLFGVGWRDPHRVVPNEAVKKWCKPNGKEPAWLPVIHAMTRIVAKLSSSDGSAALAAKQSLDRPLYTPASLSPEMPAEMIDVVAVYAGECVRDINDIRPASQIVEDLA